MNRQLNSLSQVFLILSLGILVSCTKKSSLPTIPFQPTATQTSVPTPTPTPTPNGLIDDFEDGNLVSVPGEDWYAKVDANVNDEVPVLSTVQIENVPGGVNSGSQAMAISGILQNSYSWVGPALMCMSCPPPAFVYHYEGIEWGVDVGSFSTSDFKKIRFWAKGKPPEVTNLRGVVNVYLENGHIYTLRFPIDELTDSWQLFNFDMIDLHASSFIMAPLEPLNGTAGSGESDGSEGSESTESSSGTVLDLADLEILENPFDSIQYFYMRDETGLYKTIQFGMASRADALQDPLTDSYSISIDHIEFYK